MLLKVWRFLKNPVYKDYSAAPLSYKRKLFVALLLLNLGIGLAIVILNSLIEQSLGLNIGTHASEELLSEYTIGTVFFLIVVAAPVLEELFFRAPLGLFKNSKYFKWAYYISIIGFGLMHIFNFENTTAVILMTPLLVAPQLVMGAFLGYIRTRLGFIWAVLLHATHNGILVIPFVLLKIFHIEIE